MEKNRFVNKKMKNNRYLIKKNVGLRFKKARETFYKTQKELANNVGLDTTTISDIERGKIFPNIPLILLLSENHRISPYWILSGNGNMFIQENSLRDFISEDLSELCELAETIPEIKQVLLSKLAEAKEIFKEKVGEYEKAKKKKSSGDIDTSEAETG